MEITSDINVIVPANPRLLKFIPQGILRKPFQLLLGLMCLMSGVPYVFGNRITSEGQHVPLSYTRAWGLCLTLGGIFLCFGILRNNPLVQRAGLSLLAPTAFVYAIILVKYIGWSSAFSVSIIVAFSLACLIEDYTIKIATQSIKQVFRDHGTKL